MVPVSQTVLLCLVCFSYAQDLDAGLQCGTSLTGFSKTEKRVQAPWTALIFRKGDGANGVFVDWMSGVIIGSHTVLTRGRQFWEAGASSYSNHNDTRPQLLGFNASNLLVGVGISNSKNFTPDSYTQLLQVTLVRPHPKSYVEHSETDFAILQLRQRIQLSSKVLPVCVQAAESAVNPNVDDLSSAFWKTSKRLTGFRHWADHSIFSTAYKVTPSDFCDSDCQSRSPSSTAKQLLIDGGPPCPPPPAANRKQLGGDFGNYFRTGASLVSWHIDRWYLAGIVTKSYGCRTQFKHFISLVGMTKNLNWIRSNIQNGLSGKYTCMDGSGIEVNRLCNGVVECIQDGGSDEEESYCTALNCRGEAEVVASNLCQATPDDATSLLVQNTHTTVLRFDPGHMSLLNAEILPLPSFVSQKVTKIAFPTPPPSTLPPPTTTTAMTKVKTVIATSFLRCPPVPLTPKEKEGIRFYCTSPDNKTYTGSVCSDMPQASGTRIHLTCLPLYKAVTLSSFTDMTCGSDGAWIRGNFLVCRVECGLPKPLLNRHIVNGTVTEPRHWPWNAAIFKKVQGKFTYTCGATLITTSHLLTAAHCIARDVDGDGRIDGRLYKIVLAPSSSQFNANLNNPVSQILPISRVYVQELYNPVTFEADIAILQTGSPVTVSESVYPACFPFPGRASDQIERFQTSPGSVGVVVGFGVDEKRMVSEHLKLLELPVVSARDCYKVLDIFPSTAQICAGHTTGASVCNGDSGAGFLFQEEGALKLFYLQGVVSHGQYGEGHFCDYNKYSIFTRIGIFKEWVERVVSAATM